MKVTQWEYKYENIFDEEKENFEKGKQGWEAVGINSNRKVLYKRPVGFIDIPMENEPEVEKASPDKVEQPLKRSATGYEGY